MLAQIGHGDTAWKLTYAHVYVWIHFEFWILKLTHAIFGSNDMEIKMFSDKIMS